jgi:hypothetical protein
VAHGGKREGAGRKPKADEVALVERLSPLDKLWFKQMEIGLKNGDFPFIKLFADYRFGKPKERLDVTTDGDKLTGFTVEVIRKHETGNSD